MESDDSYMFSMISRLKEQRARLDLGSRELGLCAGLSSSFVSNLETGVTKRIYTTSAARLARALGVRLAWLLEGEEPREVPTNDRLDTASSVDTLDP
jgi:transcriptional regulator with XRE-family HTH domain